MICWWNLCLYLVDYRHQSPRVVPESAVLSGSLFKTVPHLSIYVQGLVLAIVSLLRGSLPRFHGRIRTLQLESICKLLNLWMEDFGGVVRFEHFVSTPALQYLVLTFLIVLWFDARRDCSYSYCQWRFFRNLPRPNSNCVQRRCEQHCIAFGTSVWFATHQG